MLTEDKVTELFCMADDFCKFFDAMMEKYTLYRVNKQVQYSGKCLKNSFTGVEKLSFCLSRIQLTNANLRNLFVEALFGS